MHAVRAAAAKVVATIGEQINPGLYGSRLCSGARRERLKVHGGQWERLCSA